jgi:hypothetical protein
MPGFLLATIYLLGLVEKCEFQSINNYQTIDTLAN